MKRFLHVFTTIYILAALLFAYQAVATSEKVDKSSLNRAKMDPSPQVVRDNQRLDRPYKIVLWTADWCSACKRYKRTELPILKEKYEVIIKDYDKHSPRGIKFLPTIQLFYNDKLLKTKVYWTAKEIEQYID